MRRLMTLIMHHRAWTIRLVAALVLAILPLSAHAALLYDQALTSEVLYGSGNINEKFTVSRANGVELGLRASLRYPAPLPVYNSQGNGNYGSFNTNAIGAFSMSIPTSPTWHFDWSANSNYDGSTGFALDDLTYTLRLDTDPGIGTSYTYTIDPINLAFADHGIGNNSTPNGAGDNDAGRTPATYATLIATNNVAQNSWRYPYFVPFDPTLNANYTIQLEAFQGSTSLGLTSITVIVGEGAPLPPAPEPGTCLMLLTGMCGMIAVRRRTLAAC